jgi:hypothetical protein
MQVARVKFLSMAESYAFVFRLIELIHEFSVILMNNSGLQFDNPTAG